MIVDGVDNFPTRYLLNDATVRLKIPVVSASILGFDGQLSVFKPYDGPCYRCLFREPPPAELAPSCGANGVLGVLPGTMGLLQATEVIKLILDIGEPAIGRLLLYDALGATLTEVKVHRDPECPICSRAPEEITDEEIGVFPDYEAFCAARRVALAAPTWRQSRFHRCCARPSAARSRSSASGANIGEVLRDLAASHPATQTSCSPPTGAQPLRQRLSQRRGRARARRARHGRRRGADTLVILPAMAGGTTRRRTASASSRCRPPTTPATWLIACSASAVIVSDGFTPTFAGTPSRRRRAGSRSRTRAGARPRRPARGRVRSRRRRGCARSWGC